MVGTVDFVQKVHAITPDQMEGVYDLIIYMAKQTYNDTAIPQIAAHIDENSTVCVCQNGIPEYAVSAVIGEERVVGAPVGWGARPSRDRMLRFDDYRRPPQLHAGFHGRLCQRPGSQSQGGSGKHGRGRSIRRTCWDCAGPSF